MRLGAGGHDMIDGVGRKEGKGGGSKSYRIEGCGWRWSGARVVRFSCWLITRGVQWAVGGAGASLCSVSTLGSGSTLFGDEGDARCWLQALLHRTKHTRSKSLRVQTEMRLHQTNAAHRTPRYQRASPARHSNHRHDQSRQSLHNILIAQPIYCPSCVYQ